MPLFLFLRSQRFLAGVAGAGAAALLLTVLALLFALDQHPLLLPQKAPPTFSFSLPGPTDAEAVLVLEPESIKAAAATGSLERFDSSAAWWSFLRQTVGSARIESLQELQSARLEGVRLLVVSSSAAALPPPPSLEEGVGGVLSRTGVVVLERPHPQWQTRLEVMMEPPEQANGRVTATAWPLEANERLLLHSLRLPTRFQGLTSKDSSCRSMMEVERQSVALLCKRGGGSALVLGIDLGRAWQLLQQGKPETDMSVANRYPEKQNAVLETNDLVADPNLLTSSVPVADLLEEGLFGALAEASGLVRIWGYPHAAPGAFLMTHDEEGMGDGAAWMAETYARQGCATTTFLVPSPALSGRQPDPFATLTPAAVAEVGLHYVLPRADGGDHPGSGFDTDGRYHTYGVWKIRPFRALLSPSDQWRWLEHRFPGLAPISRTHFLSWSASYSALFEHFVTAGIRIDSSYGPDIQDRGYLFGTGRPFTPLGANGSPLPILELPFLSAEDLGGADRSFFESLLADSRRTYHQAITVLFHPNSFRWHPSVSNYDTWKQLCTLARAEQHEVTTLSTLEHYEEARLNARVHSEMEAIQSGRRLRVEFSSMPEGGTFVLPSVVGGLPLEVISGAMAGTPVRMRNFGLEVILLAVDGEGTLIADYAPIATEREDGGDDSAGRKN